MNFNKYECLLILEDIYSKRECLFSACFIKDVFYNICIIPTYFSFDENGKVENLKVFNLNGEKIKEINNSNEYYSSSIEYYYDKKSNKNYIITNQFNCIKSYDYDFNKIYHLLLWQNIHLLLNFYHELIYNLQIVLQWKMFLDLRNLRYNILDNFLLNIILI